MDIINSVNIFLDRLFKEIDGVGISLDGLQIDHVAYRTESTEEFEMVKKELSIYGEYMPDANVRGRRISVLKLYKPFVYRQWQIEAIEILEPAQGDAFKSGWEHLEVVVANLDEIAKKYPLLDWNLDAMNRKNNPELTLRFSIDLAIRFHPISIINARKILVEKGEL